MEKAFITKCVDGNDEVDFRINYDELNGCIAIFVDNKEICSLEWDDNFKPLIQQMLKEWK